MGILSSFSKLAPNRVFIAIILGILSGVCFSFLIPLLMSSINHVNQDFKQVDNAVTEIMNIEVVNVKMATFYFIACILIMSMRSLSEILLIRVGSELAKNLRIKFYHRICNTNLLALENVGSSKLTVSINLDIPRIIAGGRILPTILVNIVTLAGMLGFLYYINANIFKLVIVVIVIGITLYQIPMIFGRYLFSKSRDFHDKLQESIGDLIYGAKELKLDVKKNEMFLEKLLYKNEVKILESEKLAYTITRITMGFGDLIAFFVIGLVCFVFVNYFSISSQELVGVVMVLLYVTGPIAVLLNTVPVITMANISYRKVNALFKELPSENISKETCSLPEWKTLELRNVEYSYPSDNDNLGFTIGPLNLKINKGEVTFIVGANGSGKSTLSKLLTLHFTSTSGEIYFGNTVVNDDNLTSCRQQISAIYSNYHLFSNLLLDYTDDMRELVDKNLKRFKLDKKLSVNNGTFSTTSLSDGQKKRLALLVAFLDEKDVYLFDEWAADQDPEFKHIFYTEILQELKMRGKAIIVISHDDRYFYVADKYLTMEEGKLIESISTSKVAV